MKKTILSIGRFMRLVLLFCLAFLVNGCQTPDRDTSITAPAWQYTVDHFAGSLQSGPKPGQTVEVDPDTTS